MEVGKIFSTRVTEKDCWKSTRKWQKILLEIGINPGQVLHKIAHPDSQKTHEKVLIDSGGNANVNYSNKLLHTHQIGNHLSLKMPRVGKDVEPQKCSHVAGSVLICASTWESWVALLNYHLWGDFPGGPLGKTPRSQCRGPNFDPWSGN